MRIFSDIHDYYDGFARSWQGDSKRVFERKQEDHYFEAADFPNIIFPNTNRFALKDTNHSLDIVLIGFCGEFYPVVRVDRDYFNCYSSHYLKTDDPNSAKHCEFYYSPDELDEFYNNSYLKSHIKPFYNQEYSSFSKLFLELKCSYFLIQKDFYSRQYVIDTHPVLSHWGWQTKMSDFECWQKIEQYLANDLVPPDMIEHEVSDELKAQSHGFNKFSFRKEKQK